MFRLFPAKHKLFRPQLPPNHALSIHDAIYVFSAHAGQADDTCDQRNKIESALKCESHPIGCSTAQYVICVWHAMTTLVLFLCLHFYDRGRYGVVVYLENRHYYCYYLFTFREFNIFSFVSYFALGKRFNLMVYCCICQFHLVYYVFGSSPRDSARKAVRYC